MSLETLLLADPQRRQQLEYLLVQVVENEIANKPGADGMLVRTVHSIANQLRPGIVNEGIHLTLPSVLTDIQPDYTLSQTLGQSFTQYFLRVDRRVVVLKAVHRAFQQMVARYPLLGPSYHLVKGKLDQFVIAALPALGVVIERFL